MKTFKEYLLESKQTYHYKIKIAGTLPEDASSKLKSVLEKFKVAEFKSGKKTPIQTQPLDFPEMRDTEVHIFEAEVEYPTTTDVMAEYVARHLLVSPHCVKVRTNGQEAELEKQVAHSPDNLSGESLLASEYTKENNQDLVGAERVTNLFKELARENLATKDAPKGNQDILTNEEGKSLSPVGSKQNDIPNPLKGK